MKFVEFVLALVDAATFHKVITIRRTAALEVSFFHKLPQAGTGTDRSFFAFAVCLPEADIVQQFVSVVVESLLTLLGTPYPDAVSYKPFYDKCCTSQSMQMQTIFSRPAIRGTLFSPR